jgi:hypothetical protein
MTTRPRIWSRHLSGLVSAAAVAFTTTSVGAQEPPLTPTDPPPTSPTPTPAATPPTPPTPSPLDDEDDDGGMLTIKSTRNVDMQQFAESSLQEIKVVGARTRYALNLFGDFNFRAASRSEGALRRPEPAFGTGVFDMLFTADLENQLTLTTEATFTYEPHSPQAELERLHMRWRPNKFFYVEAGRIHTDIGYWNVAYHHGKFLQLSVERPRMLLLHGGLLPVHWQGIQTGVNIPAGRGTISLAGTVGASRERIGSAGHQLHGSAFSLINGVHGKLEFSGFFLRDLRFGLSGVYSRIPAEQTFVRPAVPDQPIDEKVGNAFIALPSVPVVLISEAYVIEHSLTASARPEDLGSKWRTFGAFAMLGYQIGRFTPFVRGEYIGSQVGANFFNPFYQPEKTVHGGFRYTMDGKEGVLGTRIDFSDWNSLKLEYQLFAGVGTRDPGLPTPAIHTAMASWQFGI